MIKEVKIVQCDICGVEAKITKYDSKNEIILPSKWHKGLSPKAIHICPICSARLGDRL